MVLGVQLGNNITAVHGNADYWQRSPKNIKRWGVGMTNASITLKKLKGGTVRYIFNNEISIKTVLAQREIVLGSLKYSKKIYLNVNRVTKIDSAGLQLLYLIKLEAKRRDIEINIGENSKLLIQLLPKLKLVGDLSCQQALGWIMAWL